MKNTINRHVSEMMVVKNGSCNGKEKKNVFLKNSLVLVV